MTNGLSRDRNKIFYNGFCAEWFYNKVFNSTKFIFYSQISGCGNSWVSMCEENISGTISSETCAGIAKNKIDEIIHL